jgi:predicted small integral membrane protein
MPVRIAVAIFVGLIAAYATARIDLASKPACQPDVPGLVCISPKPDLIIVAVVGLVFMALAWLGISRLHRSRARR